MMLEKNDVELNNKKEQARAKYRDYYHKKKQNKKWLEHRNAVARINYYKRKAKKAKSKNEFNIVISDPKPLVTNKWYEVADNITKNQPKWNYPVINKDYRIIKHINAFGGLCYNIQIKKSFLGIKYWSYIRTSCGSPIQYADKHEAKRTVEAYLYPSKILTENSFK